MNKKQFAKAAGFFFLCAVPARAQNNPPSPATPPSPVVRPKEVAPPPDDFAGLQFTNEQKAKMDEIHKTMKQRMDKVVKDEKLSPEQKGAFLDGYRRG